METAEPPLDPPLICDCKYLFSDLLLSSCWWIHMGSKFPVQGISGWLSNCVTRMRVLDGDFALCPVTTVHASQRILLGLENLPLVKVRIIHTYTSYGKLPNWASGPCYGEQSKTDSFCSTSRDNPFVSRSSRITEYDASTYHIKATYQSC